MAENLPVRGRKPEHRQANGGEIPRAPKHLSRDSRRIWREIVEEWVLGPDALPLLQAALECLDRYHAARDRLAADGPVVTNPTTGMVRTHPAHAVARDNLREWRQLWRQLGLEPPQEG